MTPPALDLDWQLRRAADSLRRTTASIPVGAPPPPRRRAKRIAAGVVLVVAVVAGAALIWKGDQRREPKVTTGPPESDVTPLILDPLPPGMSTRYARDLPATADGLVTLTLYQGTLAFDGNAAVDLGVAVVTDETVRREDGTPVTVRGHEGAVTDEGFFGGPSVSWEESGVEVTLASHTLDTSLLLGIAEGLQVGETSEDSAVELGPLPNAIAALAPVAQLEAVDVSSLTGVTQSHRGHVIRYDSDSDSDSGIVDLVVTAGGTETLAILTWASDADQSHDAGGRTIYTAEQSEGTTAVWQEDDGTVVQLVASDTDTAALVALVTDHVRQATRAEWQAVIEEHGP